MLQAQAGLEQHGTKKLAHGMEYIRMTTHEEVCFFQVRIINTGL